MNKCKRKRRNKKKHGYNPLTAKQINSIENASVEAVPEMIGLLKDLQDRVQYINGGVENIRNMPEEEFLRKLELLTPENQELAWKIRGIAE